MRFLISGSTGFIGSHLIPRLISRGDSVVRLVRKPPISSEEIHWDPDHGVLDSASLEGLDAVIHLAGENIAGGRWTASKKKEILESRRKGTQLLSETLARLNRRPSVFVCASAIGYYGDRGDEVLTESSSPGTDFLANVCIEWEKATQPAARAGIRVVNTRFGIILSKDGGALPRMLVPFQLGLGGRLGSGNQYMSWIALDDIVGIMLHVLSTDSISGPVNAVAGQPVRNSEFTRTLANVLSRPAIFPVPAVALKLLLGEMAEALLLSSAKVKPEKLGATYSFAFPDLATALRHILHK